MKLRAQDILNAALFSALTAIGALIHIPLPLVPISLQTLFTYLAGALLGGYLGALSQLIYVLMGVAGLPIFAKGGAGISWLVGPTSGYLIGFIPGAFAIGKLAEVKRNPSFRWLLTCMTAGTAIIYALGVLQLMNSTRIGVNEAIVIGVLPFIVGDALKMLAAAYMTIRIRKVLPR
ncbi:MAG: biotin transporter BioY [Candidatus Bathyarchaeia archaeon]